MVPIYAASSTDETLKKTLFTVHVLIMSSLGT